MRSSARALGTTAAMVFGLAGCDEAFHFDVSAPHDAGNDADDVVPPPDPSACTTDATCGGLRCHVASGVCVACLQNGDCTGTNLKRCEPTMHVCVACLNGPDCGARQNCDTVTNRCLDVCFDADDPCPTAGFVCDHNRALCIECTTSANCAGSAKGPLCDVPIGRCVECTGNAQCPPTKPVCDRRSGSCHACVVSPTCGASAVCDPAKLTCRGAT